MKYLLACLLCGAVFANAQSDSTNVSYGVYTSAADFSSHTVTNGFAKSNSKHKLKDEPTHEVRVTNNGITKTYSYDSIWGFRRKNSDWRIFENRVYKVEYNGKACVYSRPTKTDFSSPGLTRFETTYFSATPESEVYPLTQANLLLVYKNNPALVAKVRSLHPSDRADQKDKATGAYEFISWL